MTIVDEAYIQKLLRTVNHDMSATLRSSVGFSTLILSEYEDTLDEKVKKWLRLNIEQGEQTQVGLIALSEYARLYDIKEQQAHCDLAALVEKVFSELQVDRGVGSISIDNQLCSSISGYRLLWLDYFRQLIKNCMLHSGGNRCTLSEEAGVDTFKIIIEDNGIGLDEKQVADAILPFRKLNNTPTVGLGLSRAKRITEAHGGQLYLCPRKPDVLGLRVEAILPSEIAGGATLLSY